MICKITNFSQYFKNEKTFVKFEFSIYDCRDVGLSSSSNAFAIATVCIRSTNASAVRQIKGVHNWAHDPLCLVGEVPKIHSKAARDKTLNSVDSLFPTDKTDTRH